jgi:hypothetical protein
VIANCLTKSQTGVKIRLTRLLPDRVLQRVLDEHIFLSNDLRTVIGLIGVLLQVTDDFNLVILAYLAREEMRCQVTKMLTQVTADIMMALVRCIVA